MEAPSTQSALASTPGIAVIAREAAGERTPCGIPLSRMSDLGGEASYQEQVGGARRRGANLATRALGHLLHLSLIPVQCHLAWYTTARWHVGAGSGAAAIGPLSR